MRGLLEAAALIALAGAAPAQEGRSMEATQVAWVSSYEEARQQAEDLKKPLLVCFNMDGEVANDRAAQGLYRDRKFVALSRDFVCVICSVARHATVKQEVGGVSLDVCERFGVVDCAQHRQCEIRASDELVGRAVVVAPQHILVAPDGTLLERRLFEIPKDELMRLMNQALGRVLDEKGQPREELKPVDAKALLAEVEEELAEVRKVKRPDKRKRLRVLVDRPDPLVRARLLEAMVEDDDESMRSLLMEMLARRGDFKLMEPLLQCLKDRNDVVSLGAVDALGLLGIPDATEPLKGVLRRHKTSRDHGRVVLAYAACGHADPKVRKDVLREAKSSDDATASYGLAALWHFGEEADAQKALDKALKSGSQRESAAALWSIGMAGLTDYRDQVAELAETEGNQIRKKLLGQVLAILDQELEDPEKPAEDLRDQLKKELRVVLQLKEGRR